jgi:DNA segregation ATPase FtsK/SpoIIIE, S-DNA-T family
LAQATPKRTSPSFPIIAHLGRSLREAVLYLFTALGAYLLLSLLSYHSADPAWSYAGMSSNAANLGGRAGAWFSDISLYLFGYLAYLLPLVVVYLGWALFQWQPGSGPGPVHIGLRALGFVLTLAAGGGLATLHLAPFSALPLGNSGGILGDTVGHGLEKLLNFSGTNLLLCALFLAGVSLFSGLSWLHLADAVGGATLRFLSLLRARAAPLSASWGSSGTGAGRSGEPGQEARASLVRPPARRVEPVLQRSAAEPAEDGEADESANASIRPVLRGVEEGTWHLPIELLDAAEPARVGFSSLSLEEMSRQVELKLRDFGIEVQVVAVQPGPVITRFELEPVPGLKASRITNLSRDLARALSVISVRVVEVIPGKSVVGLEIPNEHREVVRLRELLASEVYQAAQSPLTVALGKDVGGQPVVANLSKMPHLLVAGTTGSGKSVAINAMVLSLLFNASPREVRLIMVDPKMLELSVYERIPHLLAPVVTDMKEAANALRWCVAEMERRYRVMSALGVRNLAGYNRKIRDALTVGHPLPDPFCQDVPEGEQPPGLQPLPLIVVIVDELADMMMVVGKKVEELIARLAQKARASGIHLILATQRPSVDVITGLIKANIPTRIAFQVSSRVDSRTILDQMGAEQLLGQGDMLYLPPGTGIPRRVHGAFVADHEVHAVAEHLKSLGPPDYLEDILREAGEAEAGSEGEDFSDAESDPLYDQAVRIVTETRRASISGVQRRLKIGYNRAARMIEAMEHTGLVGPLQSNGSREVLVPPPMEG